MNEEKSDSIIGGILDFVFGCANPEEEAAQERSAAIIYGIMDFISRNKDSDTHRFTRDLFCSTNQNKTYSCAEAVGFGIEQGWIEEVEDKIAITEYGYAYEKDFWKSFR